MAQSSGVVDEVSKLVNSPGAIAIIALVAVYFLVRYGVKGEYVFRQTYIREIDRADKAEAEVARLNALIIDRMAQVSELTTRAIVVLERYEKRAAR